MTPPDVSDAAVEAALDAAKAIEEVLSPGLNNPSLIRRSRMRAAIAAAVEVMGVAGLIEAARVLERKSVERSKTTSSVYTSHVERLRTALANVTRLRTQENADV